MTSEANIDKRIQKTLLALRESFFDLVLTYSYDEIKVSHIIEKANVGRSTFYQHYRSKDDILVVSMSKLLDDLAMSVTPQDNLTVITQLMDHFWENRQFAPKIFSGNARRVVVQALAERIQCQLKQQLKASMQQTPVPLNIAAHQIAEAQLVPCIDWLLGKGRCTAHEMAQCIEDSTKALVGAYVG